MKLKLPLALLASLFICMNTANATATTDDGTTTPEMTETVEAVVGTAENNWGLRQDTASNNWNVDGNVIWDATTPATTVNHNLNIGDYKGDATLTVAAGANTGVYGSTFIGGTGYYGETAEAMPEGYDYSQTPITPECNNEGTLNIEKGATFTSATKQKDPTGAHLAIGWGRYCTGTVNVKGGEFIVNGALYLNQHYDATGTLNVTDKGHVRIQGDGIQTYAGYSSQFYVGNYGVNGEDKGGFVNLEGGSTLEMVGTTSAYSYFIMARGGAATDRTGISYGASRGEMTLSGKSSATFTDTLNYVGYSGTGIISVTDGSSLTFNSAGIEGNQYASNSIYLGVYSGSVGSVEVSGVHEDGTASALNIGGSAILGYASGSSGEIAVKSGASATMGQTLIGYYTGSTGMVTVDGAGTPEGAKTTLTAGNTYVGAGDATGSLYIKNGAEANLNYLSVGGTVSVDNATLNVADGVYVKASGSFSVTQSSIVNVTGDMYVADGGKVTVDNTSTLSVTGNYDIQKSEEGAVSVGEGSKLDVGSMSNANAEAAEIALESNSTLNVSTYTNAGGDTMVSTADSTSTCYIGNVELTVGNMVLSGGGQFTLGKDAADAELSEASNVFTVSGQSAESATSTYIDASNVSTDEGSFTLLDGVSITLNFADSALASIAAGAEETFTLTLIRGNSDFKLIDDELIDLMRYTGYNIQDDTFEEDVMVMALSLDETVNPSDFSVTSAQYVMDGNNLVWTGTVKNNAVPEPTTATLSLLALAALAARRRRR